MMNVNIIDRSMAQEPDQLEEMKGFLRITHDVEDELIQSLMVVARESVEMFTGRSVVQKTYELVLDDFQDEIILPYPPLQTVEKITYLDADKQEHEMDPGDYAVSVSGYHGKVMVINYPQQDLFFADAVRIQYVAGYDPQEVPEAIKQAIRMLVTHLYENREAVTLEGRPQEMPMSVQYLLMPHRVWS